MKGFLQKISQDFIKKKYLEHQTLRLRVVCSISPANQHIILQIDGFHIRTVSSLDLFPAFRLSTG